MYRIVLTILLTCFNGSVFAQSNNLDDLLKEVKQARHQSDKLNQQREQRFRQERNKRKQILEQVQAELEQAKKRSEQLKNNLQENDKQLAELDEQIRLNSANLGELFGVVRQISGEAHATFKNSIISIQYPQRGEFLKRLSDSQSLPSIKDLNQLWYELQRQMTQSGKTAQFKHTKHNRKTESTWPYRSGVEHDKSALVSNERNMRVSTYNNRSIFRPSQAGNFRT